MSLTQPAEPRSEPRRRRAIYPAATVLITVLLGAARLLGTRAFYFADDTQTGAFGQWWELGRRILGGSVTILSPQAWQAGNYLAEGQWGLLNPVVWAIAIGAHLSDDAAIYSSMVKLAFLGVMALGVYLLARSFGADARWAAVAGVLAPLGGFTVYMDAASWATGLFNAALVPWVWWGLRRSTERGKSPIAYLLAGYVLIAFGYVFGVIVLAIILVVTLAEKWIRRDWVALRRVIVASAYGGLLTVALYLPGVLTAPVTERAGMDIINSGFLNADLTDLGATAAPLARGTVGAWSGIFTDAPLPYVAWVIPMLALFLPCSRALMRSLLPVMIVTGVMLIVVLGPSHIGPIRWPIRFIPYVAIGVVVIFAVLATKAYPAQVTRRRMWVSLLVLVVMTWLAWTQTPGRGSTIALVAVAVVQAAVIVALAAIATTRRVSWTSPQRSRAAVGGVLIVTAALVAPQMLVFPATPLPTFAVPHKVADLESVLPDGPGDAIVVGNIYQDGGNEAAFDEILLGNLWYLSSTSVSSLYTVLPFSAYAADLCMDLRGSTCAGAYDTLMSKDEETGLALVDLLAVSTVVVIKSAFSGELPHVPSGWSVVSDEDYTWELRRAESVAPAGGVVWASSGTEVSVEGQDETSISVRVDRRGDDARMVLSRLAWPGYVVSGAALSDDPVRGYLLTIDLSDAAEGDVVRVEFRPPGYFLSVAAFLLAAGLLIGWPVVGAIRRGRAVVHS